MSGPRYFFDESQAQAECAEYMQVAAAHKAEHQADVDGFWRVLRAAAERGKLRLRDPEPSSTRGLSPEGPYRG